MLHPEAGSLRLTQESQCRSTEPPDVREHRCKISVRDAKPGGESSPILIYRYGRYPAAPSIASLIGIIRPVCR